ncbi:hypothetical protein [Bradyrhizobium japonicum]|uniref:hypothetical protein n=1 Tax=Bradyrhizobium japonicum TaxID=375 RepID=UPI001E34E808|nr:hypothetical protein [Bradyrhizobium japonicum]MCD9821158.1 hypothetical protein [Bradyrhizobium japonicum]MEB2674145.1 hypothetical protein [Bradyrhizobium japonicum]WRI93331.1 hypothetical protein R3F75_21305 [Bradyrhizobium japonicum]
MSNKSMADIGRALAAALLAEAHSAPMLAVVAKLKKTDEMDEIGALAVELMDEYRTDILETLRE